MADEAGSPRTARDDDLKSAEPHPAGSRVARIAGAAACRAESVLGLLPTWLAIGWLVYRAQWFWRYWPELEFGWIVLMLSGYLFWEAWGQRQISRWRCRPATLGLAAAGLPLVLFVQVYEAAFGGTAASIMALAVGLLVLVAANLHFVFGWAGVRHFGFAFGFLLLGLPLPSFLHGPIVLGLQDNIAAWNVDLLNLLGVPAQQVGSLIHLPNGAVGIDEACSGIRSLQSTVMATLFIGYLTLRRFWLQALLFGAGIFLAIVGNVGRSLFLSLMANAHGVKSIDRYHDTAGWSILLFTACGVALLAWLLSRLNPLQGQPLNVKSTLDS